MPTNHERASRVLKQLKTYGVTFSDPADLRATLTDLLADLMHVDIEYPELRLNFFESLRMAEAHFEAESREVI